MFIEPREFVTFCHHRWLRDGTQLIVNQAWDHPAISSVGLRAYALRGASYISPHPNHPNSKTSIVILAHASCGKDAPEWLVRTAVSILAPIKPFEIITRINKGVQRARAELEREEASHQLLAPPGRTNRPAGIAQIGYGCFWPEGGGIQE